MARSQSAFVMGVAMAALAAGCHRPPLPAESGPPAAAVDRCAVALAAGAEAGDPDRAIARAQQDARTATRSRQALERLGYLYVSRARLRSDPGDYTLALAAADCLESRHPQQPAVLLLRGHVLHQQHRFREAEQIARTLVARRTSVLDYGLLGDALMEQGQLAEAAAAYQKMIDLKPFYQSYTRAAHVRWLRGDLDGAVALLRLAIASASPRDAESSAWAWTRLSAHQLQAGRLAEAESSAARALRHQPDYPAALLARGRTLLAMRRTAHAVDALGTAARLNPLPEYQWILADALRLDGDEDGAARVERDLVERGAASDPRTLALYLATRSVAPDRALALSADELAARADVFTLDAHAWALAANGRPREARDTIRRATAEGTQDARLFLHAGIIHLAAGEAVEGRRWLRKADALKAMLLPSELAALTRHLRPTL